MPKPLPILQSIPHAGLAVPPSVQGRLAIDAVALYNECDLWADQLYDFAHPDLRSLTPAGNGPGVLASITMPIARALVDANREPDDLANPDGPVKTQTSYGAAIYQTPLDEATRRALLADYWQPFHDQLAAALDAFADETALFLDCHNMAQRGPAAYHFAGAARPLVCLANLGDETGEPQPALGWTTCSGALLRGAAAIAHELFADLPLVEPNEEGLPPVVALNWPFAGGTIIRRYARTATGAPRLPAIMVEVNRGLFVGNQSAQTAIQPPNEARIRAVRQRLYQWAVAVVDLAQAEKA
jgi:N-formylglutamate amidohydrolase